VTTPGPSSRFLYYDGWDLSTTAGYVAEFNPAEIEEVVQDKRGPFDQWPVKEPVGHAMAGDLTIVLWADSALQNLLDDLHGESAGDRTTERVIVYGWTAGDSNANKFEGARGYLSKVEPMTPAAELMKLRVTFAINGRLSIGDIHHALGAETSDGDTEASSIDNTASSSDGGVGFFLYTALNDDGGDGLAPRIIDSDDDITFGALIAFTTVADAAATLGAERKTVSGTVERYVASDWDFTGAPGGSATSTFFLGFERL